MALLARYPDLYEYEEVLNQKCSDISISTLAKQIIKWRDLAPYFGTTRAEVEAIERDGVDENDKRRKLLYGWVTKYGDTATYCNLILTYLEAGYVEMADDVYTFIKGDILLYILINSLHIMCTGKKVQKREIPSNTAERKKKGKQVYQ